MISAYLHHILKALKGNFSELLKCLPINEVVTSAVKPCCKAQGLVLITYEFRTNYLMKSPKNKTKRQKAKAAIHLCLWGFFN